MNTQMQHWTTERDATNIVTLTLDQAGTTTNVLNLEVLDELNLILVRLAPSAPQGLIIVSGKPNGFIAGADIKSFSTLHDPAEVEALIRHAHSVFSRLATVQYPTVCVINGFCLGGGLELALACRYRVACDSDSTRLGFPEIRLGIFPGFGGSVRSIATIGPIAALNLMLSTRNLASRAAKKMGLVDHSVPERHLLTAAHELLQKQPPKHCPPQWQNLLNSSLLRPAVAFVLRKAVSKKAKQHHYPAPFALISHWQKHGRSTAQMFASEAREVATLITGQTAKNLTRIYLLQENLKALGKKTDLDLNHIHIIGAGTMGGDIAAWCALQGYTVTVQDRAPECFGQMFKRAHTLFSRKLKKPRLIQAALDRLQPDISGYGLRNADVIIEAIFENIAAKQQLYKEIEPQIKADALLATNTSSICLETLSEVLQTPDRLVGLHFFNPVARMQLLEIVHTATTSANMMQRAMAFARHIDRLPLPVKSKPGFLINRILMPYLMEAVTLLSEGVPAILIDKAAVGFGMPIGPIELADVVGLDICLSVGNILLQEYGGEQIPQRLQELVDGGHLGVKTGRGFYAHYKGNTLKQDPPKNYRAPADIAGRLIFRLLDEAVACLQDGIVENADYLDAGVIFATGFAPFRGGPLHHIKTTGCKQLYQAMMDLEIRHGYRFHPSAGWNSLISENI